MHPLPHHYRIDLVGDGRHARVTSPGRADIVGGAPPEFDGDPDVWSPEQLLLAAVGLCLFATFRAIAIRDGAPLDAYSFQDHVEGTLVKTAAGPRFSAIAHHVALAVPPAERERAERLLRTAQRHCIVAASLSVPLEVEICITARD